MSARSVARLTEAEATPGTLAMAFSTRETQEAQVMPVMPRLSWSVGGGVSMTPSWWISFRCGVRRIGFWGFQRCQGQAACSDHIRRMKRAGEYSSGPALVCVRQIDQAAV